MPKRNYARELLDRPTSRDAQLKIGPSLIGNPCDLCVARGLQLTEPEDPGLYRMGGIIGTCIHNELERRGRKLFPGDLHEKKVFIGHLDGYGDIYGKADRLAVEDGVLIDYKTTTKKKAPGLKKAYDAPEPVVGEPNTAAEARVKLLTYVGQAHLYARAMEDEGYPITEIALSFVPRDASTVDDLFQFEYEYEREFADKTWARLEFIWQNLTKRDWTSSPHCFACNTR